MFPMESRGDKALVFMAKVVGLILYLGGDDNCFDSLKNCMWCPRDKQLCYGNFNVGQEGIYLGSSKDGIPSLKVEV